MRYKFYEENTWGHMRAEIEEGVSDRPREVRDNCGLLTLSISPDDSETWTVSAVPRDAFEATRRGLDSHGRKRRRDESGSDADSDEDHTFDCW